MGATNRRLARGSDQRTALEALKRQIEGNPRGPLVEVLAEMMEARPSVKELKAAAKKNPLGFMKVLKQVAEPIIPREFHTSYTEINAADVLAEMRARGLIDQDSAEHMARALGNQGRTVEHQERTDEQ